MKIEKHGRSFLVKSETGTEQYIPNTIAKVNRKPTKKEIDSLIMGIHRSGTRTIKELSLVYGLTEEYVEGVVSK